MIKTIKQATLLLSVSVMLGCSATDSQTDIEEPLATPANERVKNIPIQCKQPVKVEDIWKLEPALTKSGKIKENMSRAEKETIILQFIEAKNSQYQLCLKPKKSL